jgi:hypothetical protein
MEVFIILLAGIFLSGTVLLATGVVWMLKARNMPARWVLAALDLLYALLSPATSLFALFMFRIQG